MRQAELPIKAAAVPPQRRVREPWRIGSLESSRAALQAACMVGSQLSVALLQGLQFFLVARALGAAQFGYVASVTAITSALVPFASLGLGNVAIARIARNQSSPEICLGNAMTVTAVTAAAGIAIAMLATLFLQVPDAWLLVLLLGTSEILLSRVIDVAAHVFMGLERNVFAILFYNLQLALRVGCALLLFLQVEHPTALLWVQLHLASSFVATGIVLAVSFAQLGRPRLELRLAMLDSRQGVFFSTTHAGRSVQTDADKFFLARDASVAVAGAYTAAFRLVYMACIPVFAILVALQARTFRHGHRDGVVGTLVALRSLLLGAVVYGVILAAMLFAAGPAVPWILGPSYQLSSEILRWLCALPLFLMVQSACSQVLSGADVLRSLALVHMATAGIAVILNVALVPRFGWQGAVLSAYGSQTFLLASLLLLTARRWRAAPRPEEAGSPDQPL